MTVKRKTKTVPCEGCRERKKKCSAGQPCERCKRLGIQCYYSKSVAPPEMDTIDSVRSQELQQHIEVLDDIMRNMERELHLLKLPLVAQQQKDSNRSSSAGYHSKLMYDKIKSTASTTSIPIEAVPAATPTSAPIPVAMTVNSTRSTTASSAVNTQWQMKLRKDGTISITTDILNYANLLRHLEAFGSAMTTTTTFSIPLVKQPTLGSLSKGGGYLQRHVLSSTLRKGNFKAIIACIQSLDRREQQLQQLQLTSTATLAKPTLFYTSLPQSDSIPSISASTPTSNLSICSSPSVIPNNTAIVSSFTHTILAADIVATMPDLISQLVDIYFSCQFFNCIICHQKTFYDLFIRKKRSNELEMSPVLCSIAAAVLTMHCKHVMKVVPYDQQAVLGEYLFNKARHLVALQFDEPSLETLITYIFMAKYKANLLRPHEANIYLEIATRMRQILAETVYKDPPTEILYINASQQQQHQHQPQSHQNDTQQSNYVNSPHPQSHNTTPTTSPSTPTPQLSTPSQQQQPYFTVGTDLKFPKLLKKTVNNKYFGEYETFKRLQAGLQDVEQFVHFINNERGVPVKSVRLDNIQRQKAQHQQRHIKRLTSYQPIPLPDEKKQTVRALLMEHFLAQLSMIVCPFFNRVRWGKDDMVPLTFLLKTEEDLTDLYRRIPLDYQLSPSIFEDGISDEEFTKRLNEDGRCDAVSVAIAERYYQSLLAVHEPFLPVIKRLTYNKEESSSSTTDIPLLIGEELCIQKEQQEKVDRQRMRERKKRRTEPSDRATNNRNQKSFFTDSEDESEDDENCDPDSVLSVHTLRAQEVCYRCAVIVVRLLEYRCTALNSCTLPRPTLLSAWDFLMRNSCLGMTKEQLERANVHQFLSKEEIEQSRKYALRCIDILRRGYLFNSAERGVWEHYEKLENQLLMALGKTKSPTARYWEPFWITIDS